MSCKQPSFPHVHEDAKGKETEVTNKRGCCKCQCTQGPLKRTADATGDSCASIKRL